MKMITIKTVDIPGDWNYEKFEAVSREFAERDINAQRLHLYINVESYYKIKQDWEYSKQYTFSSSTTETRLAFYGVGGQMYIYPTTEKEHVLFNDEGIDYKYFITNKVKEYKTSFDEIING